MLTFFQVMHSLPSHKRISVNLLRRDHVLNGLDS
jgi:hypothetical protein